MSRRAAEKAILAGEIKVNGVRAEIGQKVVKGKDKVYYKGKAIAADSDFNVYILLNKPVGYVTTMNDDRGRPCVKDLVSDVGVRVYPAGRLDMDSEGLLIMTNDGELVNRLTHPKHSIPKYFHVKFNSIVTAEQRKLLSSEMVIDDYKIRSVKNEVVTQRNDTTTLRFELYEGRNRQIRKMCEIAGLEIVSLKRVAIGKIELGNLKVGAWKKLTGSQIDYLKSACKMR